MTYSLNALLGVEGQSVNKEVDHVHYKDGSRKGEVVDGESIFSFEDMVVSSTDAFPHFRHFLSR